MAFLNGFPIYVILFIGLVEVKPVRTAATGR
jgi:hypothetical protein